jgi:UDP-N-acetylmuramoyl-L-alanyl-D-glutamate--2,6-diaminopimelate ligase
VAGCHFEAAVFTNLTQDHLDYHGTMQKYLAAKQKIFAMSDCGIINLDDSAAAKILAEAPCRAVTYSTRRMDADFTARNVGYLPDGIHYDVVSLGVIGRVSLKMPGTFSVYNSLAALSCAVTLGLPLQRVLYALGNAQGVRGRAEIVPTGRDFTIMIDYAHTPDGLLKILQSVKEAGKGRLVALFGCGGDRDKTKRPQMAKIAAQEADFLIVTSDNPRTEEPAQIIRDVLVGLEGCHTPFVAIENRKEAIRYAIENSRKDDIIVLAGKGHEDYQIIGTVKYHLDEREVVADILAELPPKN